MHSKPGQIDVSVYVYLQDAVTGGAYTAESGYDSFRLDYVRDRAARDENACNAAALAAATADHCDNKVFHCGEGIWRCDFEDAAFAAGVDRALLLVRHAGGAFLPVAVRVELWPAKVLRALLAGMGGNMTFDDDTGAASFADAEDGSSERISYTVSASGVGRTNASVS